MISSGVIKDLPISSGGRAEDQRITERSKGAPKTTTSNPSRMILTDAKARDREVARKGIARLEKQVLQYIGVYISKDLVDIALVKKCKTMDIPALNTAMGNIQKSLQRYVGFENIDYDYCNKIESLMDKA